MKRRLACSQLGLQQATAPWPGQHGAALGDPVLRVAKWRDLLTTSYAARNSGLNDQYDVFSNSAPDSGRCEHLGLFAKRVPGRMGSARRSAASAAPPALVMAPSTPPPPSPPESQRSEFRSKAGGNSPSVVVRHRSLLHSRWRWMMVASRCRRQSRARCRRRRRARREREGTGAARGRQSHGAVARTS